MCQVCGALQERGRSGLPPVLLCWEQECGESGPSAFTACGGWLRSALPSPSDPSSRGWIQAL